MPWNDRAGDPGGDRGPLETSGEHPVYRGNVGDSGHTNAVATVSCLALSSFEPIGATEDKELNTPARNLLEVALVKLRASTGVGPAREHCGARFGECTQV
jgi:hypothetical protein